MAPVCRARMHIEYLKGMFLDNDLAEGRFQVAGARSRSAI